MARSEPAFTPDALRQLRRFPVRRQRRLVDAMRSQLTREDPAATTRNKFRLRRAWAAADFELRVDDMRAFYRVAAGGAVTVTAIGLKRGSRLFIEGKEFHL